MTTFADDAGEDATLVFPRPAPLGVVPIDTHRPSEPPEEHSPTLPDASCAPASEDPPSPHAVIDALEPNVPAPPELRDRVAAWAAATQPDALPGTDQRPTVPTASTGTDDLRPWWHRIGAFLGQTLIVVWVLSLWRHLARASELTPPHGLPLPPPPPPSISRGTLASAGEVAEADRGERILDEVFRIPRAYLPGLEILVRYAARMHDGGPEGVLVGRVHLALSRMHAQRAGAVLPLARLWQRLPDVIPNRIDQALLALEEEGVLVLLPPSNPAEVSGAVMRHETRGALSRVELRRPL
jgi:hypothetical protein